MKTWLADPQLIIPFSILALQKKKKEKR